VDASTRECECWSSCCESESRISAKTGSAIISSMNSAFLMSSGLKTRATRSRSPPDPFVHCVELLSIAYTVVQLLLLCKEREEGHSSDMIRRELRGRGSALSSMMKLSPPVIHPRIFPTPTFRTPTDTISDRTDVPDTAYTRQKLEEPNANELSPLHTRPWWIDHVPSQCE